MTESPAAFERLTVFRADSTNSGAGAATMRSDDGAMLTGARMPTLKLKGATNSKTAIRYSTTRESRFSEVIPTCSLSSLFTV